MEHLEQLSAEDSTIAAYLINSGGFILIQGSPEIRE
jgi:hypothetical protein